jgi:Protein of unknown function (DUF3047)
LPRSTPAIRRANKRLSIWVRAAIIVAWASSAAFSGSAALVIDTFSSCVKNRLPCGWQKFRDIKGVSVQCDSSNYFVRLKSEKDVESIGLKIRFNVHDFPQLRWKWRVHVLPRDGRENVKKKNDSAAGVFVAFKGLYPFNKVLKYVWSATLPVGTVFKSPHSHNAMIFVVASGGDSLNTWVSEQRNVLEDFLKAFGSQPPLVEGIAIQTDSDDTGSSACADYDDFTIREYR